MKKSLKNIKLKLRNKKRKGNFVSFYDRIKEINEKEKLQACSVLGGANYDDGLTSQWITNESKDAEDLKRTNFYAALQVYPQNCFNSDFKKCCRELQPYAKNLMLILLNKDKIFSTIFKYIENSKIQNDENYFYKLLVILIKDLKDESKKYIDHILKILYDKINFNNLDLLEEIFNTYTNIFRIMNKKIISNVDKYIKISLPLLQHRNSIIKIFIADSFSYLLRKLSLHDLIECFQKLFSFCDCVKRNKVRDYCDTLSLLMLEALKVDKDKLSRKTLPFLKFIIYSLFLKTTYYCEETESHYEPIEDTHSMHFIKNAVATFFVDIYNFTKKGNFEFVEIFLTFILRNYSILFRRYYTDLLVQSDQSADALHLLISQGGPNGVSSIFPSLDNSDGHSSEVVTTAYDLQGEDDGGVEASPSSHAPDESPERSSKLRNNDQFSDDHPHVDTKQAQSSEMQRKAFFAKEIFHSCTNFFLKKILSIWIEKNSQQKCIIVETVLRELSKYAQDVHCLKLNYVSFFYIWNIYDHVFFLLNRDVVSNEGIKNMFTSLINIFMSMVTADQCNNLSRHHPLRDSLFRCFILNVDELLSRKNHSSEDSHLNDILKCIFVNIARDVQKVDIFMRSQECHMVDALKEGAGQNHLPEEENMSKKVDPYNISDEGANLHLGKIFLLFDILKNTTGRESNSTEECKNMHKKKRQNGDLCTDEEMDCSRPSSGRGSFHHGSDNTRNNNMSHEDSPTQMQTELHNLFSIIFEKVTNILAILKSINEYANVDSTTIMKNGEEVPNEPEENIQKVVQFLFAYVSLLTEISRTDGTILLLCEKRNGNKKEEDSFFTIFREICHRVEELKSRHCIGRKLHKENSSPDMNFYLNSIILDGHVMMTRLAKEMYEQSEVIENVLPSNNRFLLTCLSKWDKHEVYGVDYLKKIKNILTNLNEMNFFAHKMDDLCAYLKVFKKLFLHYDKANRKEFLQIIQFVVGICIALKKEKGSYHTTNEDSTTSEESSNPTCYAKLLPLFDCLIYLENEEYLATYDKIYESKIIDVVNYLTFFKSFNILSDYLLKVCTKVCIVELVYLLNASLVSIPKAITLHVKNFLRSYSIDKQMDDEESYHHQLEYYFFVLNEVFKMGKEELLAVEAEVSRKNASWGDSASDICEEENTADDSAKHFVGEMDGREDHSEGGHRQHCTPPLRDLIWRNIEECEINIQQYVHTKRGNKPPTLPRSKHVNAENTLKIAFATIHMVIVPQVNSLNKSYRSKLLDMYVWIMSYINSNFRRFVQELKYYSLLNVVFDIVESLNELCHVQGGASQSATSTQPQVDRITRAVKTFVSKFAHSMNILSIPNMIKFLHILCTYNEKLNNYKNDIEEMLLERNVNITKLLLNIKEEDSSGIIPILIKIIFCILKNKMKKGNKKLKKNMIFYLSNISCDNYCHILISVVYPLVNVYEGSIDYGNLLRYGEKERVLVSFLTNCQGNFAAHWRYQCDTRAVNSTIAVASATVNTNNGEGISLCYDDAFNHSSWHFGNHIIEIKKDALFKNFHFNKSISLFIEILKIMKYKLDTYMDFFLHVFVTISHYINVYHLMKKKAKGRRIFLVVKKMEGRDKCGSDDGGEETQMISSLGESEYKDGAKEHQQKFDHEFDNECERAPPKEHTVELNVKNSYLKNANKKCIESIQFIMLNYEMTTANLEKAKDFFTFLFRKNLKNIGKPNLFLKILLDIWSKNESYHGFYDSIVPNSLPVLVKAVNNPLIVSRLSYTEWNALTEKVFDVVLRLCGYDHLEGNELNWRKGEAPIKEQERIRGRIKNRGVQTIVEKRKGYDVSPSIGMKILNPLISDIIVCIRKTILRRYKQFLEEKEKGITLRKRSKTDELKIITNKELYILIELSSVNKNQKYNLHVINIIITFVLINVKSLHSTNSDHVQKLKLILVALKRLLINVSKGENEYPKWKGKKKTNYNLSFYYEATRNATPRCANMSHVDNVEEKKRARKISVYSFCQHSYHYSHILYVCYKLKSMVYEIVQRCYDVSCRVLAGDLLIMIGCIFLKIRNINRYLENFKKNMDTFLKKTNELNYNSKVVLKQIMKIPLKNDQTRRQNYYYTFLQIAQIFCGLNICNDQISHHEYDADVQFLIFLDLCNVKMATVMRSYAVEGEEYPMGSRNNEEVNKGKKKKTPSKYTFDHLFSNSNKLFHEILVRHSSFLIFNEATNDMVRDKSVQFVLFFPQFLKWLLQAYERSDENVHHLSIERDVKICVHFLVNIIIPKALNALKKNVNDFTKIALQIIFTTVKLVSPHMDALKRLDVEPFLREVKNSLVKNYVLNADTDSLFCFSAVKTNKSEQRQPSEEERTNFKMLERLLFHDLHHNLVGTFHENKSNKIGRKDEENNKRTSIIENIIDLKSENNSKGVEKLIAITPLLCYYTISKIVIPLALNYILQTSSKKETYNKTLSANSIKLLGTCTERVGIKVVYNLLELLLSELKKNSFNKVYVEKAVSHIVRTYDFREFRGMELEQNWARPGGTSSDKFRNGDEVNRAAEQNERIQMGEVKGIEVAVEDAPVEAEPTGRGSPSPLCHKFIRRILPQLKQLMFDKFATNDKKKQKSYINDQVVDFKNKEAVAKADIIISFLVILNKMNYNFEKELHKIIYRLCFCLSSKNNNVRSESKKTMCFISMYLGLSYFDLIIKQMSDYLTKGYHVPIFLCTVNSILESVLKKKDKFLDKNYLTIGLNVLNDGNIKRSKRKDSNPRSGSSATPHDAFCTNIFNMIKLEIINEIDKNTEDVNKKHIKRKTKESKKTYGKNIIKLLTNIVPEKCIENNILTFLESLFSGESFENNEVDKNFIFKKKYIFIVLSYFNNFVKGIEENRSLSPHFVLNIIYKLLTKSVYFFRGDDYQNLCSVMQNSSILLFKYKVPDQAVQTFGSFKKGIQFYVPQETMEERYLGLNYQNKCVHYPSKGNNNMHIIQGSFQEKSIYDAIGKTKKFDFQVLAQVLARCALKLLAYVVKRSSELFTQDIRLRSNSDANDNIDGVIQGGRYPCGTIKETPTFYSASTTVTNVDDKSPGENENAQKGQFTFIGNDKGSTAEAVITPVGNKTNNNWVNPNNWGSFSSFPEFIGLIEPLLVYFFCYGKEDVFVLSSKCIKIIKKKKFSDFKKFGKLIILSSVDILKNIPNYYSKEFDKLILSCIDTLTYLIRGNNKNDIISWLNSDLSYRGKPNDSVDESTNNDTVLKKKRKLENGTNSKNPHDPHHKIAKLKKQKKLNYLLDEKVLSMHYPTMEGGENSQEEEEESTNTLRYCLINQISMLLESKNHVWELLILFKNCMLREDINNLIKKGAIILKMNSCIDQIFTIMIEESHNMKLSFLCGQIYVDFLMRFPISKKEKKKKFFQILNNLNDENDDSRIATLNALYVFLNRSNAKLLKDEFYYVTFASIIVHFTNETNYKCKKMYIFLTSLLFQQVNDLTYVFNSYKMLKRNLLFCEKTSFTYTYLYLLPLFSSIFSERVDTYGQMIQGDDKLEQDELSSVSKEHQKGRRDRILQLTLWGKDVSMENDRNGESSACLQDALSVGNSLGEDTMNEEHNTIRNYFIKELLRSTKKYNTKMSPSESDGVVFSPPSDMTLFMKNQLEDLFLSVMFYLIDRTCADVKAFMKGDKLSLQVITSTQNITHFSSNYEIYAQMDKDLVYLFYKALEQIFTHMDIDLIENLVQEKHAHKMYKRYFVKEDQLVYTNGGCTTDGEEKETNATANEDTIHDKLILYFLYFWNLIIQNGLFNKNPYVQIISLKMLLNYISNKMTRPFFPLLLVKLYSSDKFIINLVLKKVLSLLLNSYFLEHFYIYHKEISVFLSKICVLLVNFPWITNGFDDQSGSEEVACQSYCVENCGQVKGPCNSPCDKDTEYSHVTAHRNGPSEETSAKETQMDNHFSGASDVEGDEEFKKVNTILEKEQNEQDKNTSYDRVEVLIRPNLKINKEMLSYSKFFLVIVTLSRAINIHLINKKKSFVRILTILNTYKNIIQDFPPELWSVQNEIINIVLPSLYKVASIFKKKYFVEDEKIFEEANTYNKLLYLSSYAWDIISHLEEKLQNDRGTFNKAFVQARQRINRIRFIKRKKKNLLALKNPKLFTLNKLKRREKKKMQKKKMKMNL
ncbi:Uncharacterized protein PCOAH_00007090 [Plasmodium coatneyi]|uniref:U3 small nucleolar RNA-associated protein 20 domain-containing protein n=1 Tax=Plasmodium coatneyi TaxID=208452 RepID=A0A1B1DUZ9_9APIC|nr:Uncharacterized protein PCOAH_00007090 [Plasmodium coatneyi]ANQ06479.1 Uncharacterized protein PCOAH_00007090 [Plasmodium coatneyi]